MDVPGDNEVSRGLDIGDALSRGVRVPGDVKGERIWRPDRTISGPGLGEAVRGGDWKPFYEMMSDGSRVTAAYNRRRRCQWIRLE